MMKYDINKKPYELLGEFTVRESNGKHVAHVRVKDWKTGEVFVKPKAEFLLKGLPDNSATESEDTAPEETQQVADESADTTDTEANIESEDDLTESENVTEYIATHTRTKEEVSISGEEELKAFIAKNNLEKEAVEAMLEGKQNTHKKWRVSKV